VGLAIAVLVFLIFTVLGLEILEIPFILVTGWLPSIIRLFSGVRPATGEATGLVLAILVLVAGTHFFLLWVYSESGKSKGCMPGIWRWRWTVCGFAMLLCTLMAVGSAILTTHQLFWLSRSSNPMGGDAARENIRISLLSHRLKVHSDQSQWIPEKVREAFLSDQVLLSGLTPIEIAQPVWVQKDPRSLDAIILIPGRPLFHDRARIMVLRPGKEPVGHKLDELPEVLTSFGLSQPN
jgi:hypothetical protein